MGLHGWDFTGRRASAAGGKGDQALMSVTMILFFSFFFFLLFSDLIYEFFFIFVAQLEVCELIYPFSSRDLSGVCWSIFFIRFLLGSLFFHGNFFLFCNYYLPTHTYLTFNSYPTNRLLYDSLYCLLLTTYSRKSEVSVEVVTKFSLLFIYLIFLFFSFYFFHCLLRERVG